MTAEWILVCLAILGLIGGSFAWSLSFFASKGQMKAFKESLDNLTEEYKDLQDNIKTLFGNTTYYQEVIKKNAATIENVEVLFQRIDDKLKPRQSEERKVV